jgi:nitrate/TMAO reductase-like tetraheme cytochrome c subunit
MSTVDVILYIVAAEMVMVLYVVMKNEFFVWIKYLGKEPKCEKCGSKTKFLCRLLRGRDWDGPNTVNFQCVKCHHIVSVKIKAR